LLPTGQRPHFTVRRAVATIRSSGNCWRLSVLCSPIPRTLGESFSEGRTEDVPGGYHR
jgi:hypothetical protein